MADNFTAENVSSAGQIFATDQEATSSAHYPIGKLAWGPLNTFNLTDTSSPFPVQLFGNGQSSSAPLFVTTDSGAPPLVAVSGYTAPSTTITVTNAPDTTVTVTGYVAPSTTVTVTNPTDTTITVTGYVAPSTTVTVTNMTDTTVTVTGYVAPSTTITVTNINGNDTTVTAILSGGESSVTVSGTVAVEPTSSAAIGLNGLSAAAGGLIAQTFDLSSVVTTVLTSLGRLYGYSVSNPDSADNAWMKIYQDDSAGVTPGTTVAAVSQMVPFGGGREASWPVGVVMSSGMSVAAAATAPSTAHDAPAATLTLTVYYLPSS